MITIKRYGNIYKRIYDIDNLRLAYKNAKKGKKHYKEVKEIEKDVDKYLYKIQQMLKDKTFTTSEYKVFKINDTGKERTIYKLPFYPDRIVQWAIMLQIEDILVNHIPEYSTASIPKRGLHKASKLTRRYIKESGYDWYLQLDIKKFFPSILHTNVMKVLQNIFKDKDLLDLLNDIISSIKGGRGLPIGNYTSQYFANLCLVPFLNYMKHELKIRYVVVYMDDIVILGQSQKTLYKLQKKLSLYLWTRLNLRFKSNYKVVRLTNKQGIDFVGYVHFKGYVLLRKSIKMRMIKRLRKMGRQLTYSDWCSINSYCGWLEWCNGYNLYSKYIAPFKDRLKEFYRRDIYDENNLQCV